MATRDVKTRFQLLFEGRGAEELQKKVEKLAASVAPGKISSGFQRMDYWMRQNERQLQGMNRHFRDLNQSLHKFGATVGKINEMADALRRVKDQAKEAGEAAQRSGRFMQGLAQGLGLGEFLPAGPGMGRQVAGRVMGGAARRAGQFGAGMASAPFTGVSGLAQGLSSIPGGGLIGGQLMAAQQNVQIFQQLQQARLSAAPFLNLAGGMAAQRAGVARFDRSGIAGTFMDATIQATEQRLRKEGGTGAIPGSPEDLKKFARQQILKGTSAPGRTYAARLKQREQAEAYGILEGMPGVAASETQLGRDVGQSVEQYLEQNPAVIAQRREMAEKAMDQAMAQATKEFDRARRGEGGEAFRREAMAGVSGLGRAGVQLAGVNQIEATQMAAQVAAASGGSLAEIRGFTGGGSDLVRASMAAQTAFGVDLGTSGTFGRAARRGGLAGARGTGAGNLAETIKDAMKAGMDASEVQDHLREVAQGINEFRRTGIPMSPQTITAIGVQFSQAGMQIGRSQFAAQQLGLRSQQVGMQGPQTAADFMLLQTVGGFEGGGLEELEAAQQRMIEFEKGQVDPQQFMELIRKISEGSGGDVAGRFAVRNVFAGFGAQLGPAEAKALQAAAEGRAPPEEARAIIEKTRKQVTRANEIAPSGVAGLEQIAMRAVSGMASAIQENARMDNERMTVGSKLVTAMKDLEQSTLNGQKAFGELGKELSAVTGFIKDMSALLPAVTRTLAGMVRASELVSWPTDQQ